MKSPFSTLVGLLAIIAMVAGAWVQGLAQATPRHSGLLAVELCADGESAVVYLDERGRPVDPETCGTRLCPDCIPVPQLAVASGPALIAEMTLTAFAAVFAERAVRGDRHAAAKLPRGPPLALT
jgi:hypothetical protein